MCVEGKLGPSQNLHIHHDYCYHLLCSLMSSNITEACLFVVSMFFFRKYIRLPSGRELTSLCESSQSFVILETIPTNQK